MIRVGGIRLGRSPRIAVPFKDRISPAAIRKAKKRGADIAELRIDLFSRTDPAHVLRETEKFRGFPALATIRSRPEGGEWDRSEKERLALFKALLPKVGAVDIELSSHSILKEVVRAARAARRTVIVSFHDFKKTPDAGHLARILRKGKAAGADIVKIAAFARNIKDVQRLADFTATNKDKGLIVIAMGKKGMVSRILFPVLGSLVTFAHAGHSTAPGQLDCGTLAKMFKRLCHRVIFVRE